MANYSEILGLELNSVAMEAHLPPDKLVFLRLLLQEWSIKHVACLWKVQGLWAFCSLSHKLFCAHAHSYVTSLTSL